MTAPLPHADQWITEADAAWEQITTLLRDDLYNHNAFTAVLRHLNQRAADLALAPDPPTAAADVEHNLAPSIGLARLAADRGQPLTAAATHWTTRVRQAVIDMAER